MNTNKLKGVRLLTDETARRRYVQIDLVTLARDPEAVWDHLDGLIAESRRKEATVKHEDVVKSLKKRKARK